LGSKFGRLARAAFVAPFNSENWPTIAAQTLAYGVAAHNIPEDKAYLGAFVNSMVSGVSSPIFRGMANIYGLDSEMLLARAGIGARDDVYRDRLRYDYSLHSLQYLLARHRMEIVHAKRIPVHGGSIRVYAAKKGKYPVRGTVAELLRKEKSTVTGKKSLLEFKKKVVISKLKLHDILFGIKKRGCRIYGISAPSRASTLVNYAGIDDGIMDCVLEVKGSHKIGKYMPGTLIPILEESKLYEDMPEYALMLSWHIADELAPKIKSKGFTGDFIIPLPCPKILKNSEVKRR